MSGEPGDYRLDLARISYALGRAIEAHRDVDGFEHAARSVDAFLGAAGVPMSNVANWSELVWLCREMFGATTAETSIPAIVADLHRQIKALSKKRRRQLRKANAQRLIAWARRPIYDRDRNGLSRKCGPASAPHLMRPAGPSNHAPRQMNGMIEVRPGEWRIMRTGGQSG